jgi:molecular chaperone GrpE
MSSRIASRVLRANNSLTTQTNKHFIKTQHQTVTPLMKSSSSLFAARPFHTSFTLRNGEQNGTAASKEEDKTTAAPEQTSDAEKIKNLEIQIDELKNKLVYSLAERENQRLRAKKDVDSAKSFGIQSFAKDLLGVADNLARCLAAVKKENLESNPQLKELWEGVSMTEIELAKSLKNNGVEKFEPVGLKFDPNTMNALTYFSDPSKEGGSVAVVMKTGYFLNGRLLRPADVGVVKPESSSEQKN